MLTDEGVLEGKLQESLEAHCLMMPICFSILSTFIIAFMLSAYLQKIMWFLLIIQCIVSVLSINLGSTGSYKFLRPLMAARHCTIIIN